MCVDTLCRFAVQVNIAVMATVKGGKRTLLPLLARAEWHMQHGAIGASAACHLQPFGRRLNCKIGGPPPTSDSCLHTDRGFLLYRADLGSHTTGLMFGARALATLVCTLPAAALADRFGRKCAILPGLATEAAAMLVMAAARECAAQKLARLAPIISRTHASMPVQCDLRRCQGGRCCTQRRLCARLHAPGVQTVAVPACVRGEGYATSMLRHPQTAGQC
jgi:hypothetical protein